MKRKKPHCWAQHFPDVAAVRDPDLGHCLVEESTDELPYVITAFDDFRGRTRYSEAK